MKKITKFSVLLLAIILMFGFIGCGEDDIDYTDHKPGSIRVRNNTNIDLVAFRGFPDLENLMGGIPANAMNHGLSRDLFTQSMDFPLYLVTADNYSSAIKGGNQELRKVAVFNVIYAFYNHSGSNNNIFQITSQSGGAGRLILENPTAWNIEIRNLAYNGTTLGFVGPYTGQQTLNFEPGDYIFYPIMRRFNPILGEIIDVQPVFPDGVIAGTPFFRPLPISGAAQTWNFLSVAQDATINMNSGAAFVRVVNNSQVGIQFFNGSTPQQTSMLHTQIRPGESQNFQVPFPRNNDGSFSFTHTSDFGVGVPGVGRTGEVPARTVRIDYLYEIQVTGSNASNIVASAMTEVQKMDIEGLFNANIKQ